MDLTGFNGDVTLSFQYQYLSSVAIRTIQEESIHQQYYTASTRLRMSGKKRQELANLIFDPVFSK